jgi:hypothetical protein
MVEESAAAPAGFPWAVELPRMLDRMEAQARAMGITGTAAVGWFRRDAGLVSMARGCGRMFAADVNLLAIAGSKIAEMCDTGRDSGSGVRPPATGEFGYQGGLVRAVGGGYVLAAFSGASGADDVVVARCALAGIAAE